MKTSRIIAIIMVITFSLLAFAGCSDNGVGSEPIKATVILVLEDGTEITHEIEVNGGLTIREALHQAKLIDDENSVSLFITKIDGHVADFMDGVTWDLRDADGEQIAAVGEGMAVDTVKLKDGDVIKFVYTVVPDFDD